MKTKVILFDLDGTLLPMDQDLFVKTYFGLLAKKLALCGYEPDKLISSVWAGTGAMIKNDGKISNEDKFWEVFSSTYGADCKKDIALFDAFYRNEFSGVKDVCGFNPLAAEAVHAIKSKGFRIALATNPLFPQIATANRIRWSGLEPEDFEFFTTYEESRYCKPNINYYLDVVEKLGVSPKECLMVGNDVSEDMIVTTIGMKVFLLTDCLINKEQKELSEYPKGSFTELMEYVDILLRSEK